MKKTVRTLLLALTAIAAASGTPKASAGSFGWGADVGTAIDVGGHDMSTVNLDAYFGLKNRALGIMGVGGGVNMMVANSCRSFPVYAIVRTNFRSDLPTLIFVDIRGGVAFNQLSDATDQTVVYLNPSLGINLATGRSYQSYITVGYTYNAMKPFTQEYGPAPVAGGLHLVSARLGIAF